MATVIGDDTQIEGKVYSKGTLRVDGTVRGEIRSDDSVIVGPSGEVYASIESNVVTISGKVHGNIKAKERLELQPTCEILGDIETAEGSLIIESGARIEGKCAMGLSKSSSARPAGPSGGNAGPSQQPSSSSDKKPEDSKVANVPK